VLRTRFIKSGRKALRPYILVSLDIVLGFGISGQPPYILVSIDIGLGFGITGRPLRSAAKSN